MSHTIYTTDAIVLHRVSTAEADITLWLLTRDLGLVIARAQGARKGTAKMQGYLQLFSLFRVSLVRGKHVWRITGTEGGDFGAIPVLQSGSLSAFARIARFVRRMILTDTQGALELFEIILLARKSIANKNAQEVELTTLAKILVSLGYIEVALLDKLEKKNMSEQQLAHIVNAAIGESHL